MIATSTAAMGQLHCLPEAPAGEAPVPFLRWKERLQQAQRSRAAGVPCVVTDLAPLSGVAVFDAPGVNSAWLARLRAGDSLLVHEMSPDRAWLRITRRDARRGDAWPDSRTGCAAAYQLCARPQTALRKAFR